MLKSPRNSGVMTLMVDTLAPKIVNEAKVFFVAPVYPFLQSDWPWKMWIFGALAYIPFLNVIIARGWRMEYIRRLGWHDENVLPAPQDTLKFLFNGIFLWMATGVFLAVPIVIIVGFGLGGWLDLWNDLLTLLQLTSDYFWIGRLTFREFANALWVFVIFELISEILAFLIENIWLIIYIPIYRIGTIRFALTGKLLKSHLAIRRNLRFLYNNLLDILLMYAFNVFNFILVLVVDTILAFTVVGAFLIPIVTFYMTYWNTGYEYGLLARVMVEQEGLLFEKDAL